MKKITFALASLTATSSFAHTPLDDSSLSENRGYACPLALASESHATNSSEEPAYKRKIQDYLDGLPFKEDNKSNLVKYYKDQKLSNKNQQWINGFVKATWSKSF